MWVHNRRALPPEPDLAAAIVGEYSGTKTTQFDLRDSFLETALYLEDGLGITLTDKDLSPGRLGDEQAILRLAERKLSGEA